MAIKDNPSELWNHQRPVRPVEWVWQERYYRRECPKDVLLGKLEIESERHTRMLYELGGLVSAIHNGVGHIGKYIFETPPGMGAENPNYSGTRTGVGFTPAGDEQHPAERIVKPPKRSSGIGFRA